MKLQKIIGYSNVNYELSPIKRKFTQKKNIFFELITD